jgi:Secretion system C-terminal sorting domain
MQPFFIKASMIRTLIILLFFGLFPATSSQAQQSFEIFFGDSSQQCNGGSIVQLPSGNLLVLAHCIDTSSANIIYIYKFSNNGIYISKTVIPVNNVHADKMKLMPDGNLIFAGSIVDSTGNYDGLLIKTDTAANLIWYLNYGRSFTNESFSGVDFLPSGGIIATGYTKNPSGPGNAFYAVAMDTSGNSVWEQTYSTPYNSYSDAVIAMPDGTLMISGDRALPSNIYTNTTIHTDSAGAIIWELQMPNPYNNGCKNDLRTSDNDILIVGESSTASNPIFDPSISRIDTTGNVKWSYIYPGSAVTTDALFDIVEINPQQFITVGYGGNPVNGSADLILMQIDSAGNETARFYIGDTSGLDIGVSVIKSQNGQGVYIAGSTVRNGNNKGYLIYRSLSSIQTVSHAAAPLNIKMWPNPSSGSVNISGLNNFEQTLIQINDLQGRLIVQSVAKEKDLELSWLVNGIYIVKFISASNSVSLLLNIIH